jgi:hypothetical protein
MAQSRIERMLKEVRITSYGKLAVLTIAAAGAAVIVTITSLTSHELTAADRAALQTADTASPLRTDSSSYFPAQYVNQATEASEHIQGF